MNTDKGKKRFAIMGVAGYIAPAHLKAIKSTGNTLVGAFDPNDSVGVLDSYFPEADFFTEFERFDRFIHKLQRNESSAIDYISICSPNYLHDSHVRFALRSGADAICEKPVALNPWNIEALEAVEQETGRKVFTVLQLRLHPAVIALKSNVAKAAAPGKKFEVTLTYITARGKWYFNSWKGDEEKSGGVTTNIGVHFFDMLYFVFGKVVNQQLHYRDDFKAAGVLEYENASVRWFLSIDAEDLPLEIKIQGKRTLRSLNVNGEALEFSEGFADLHTLFYQSVLAGKGFGLAENRSAIELAAVIRTQTVTGNKIDFHSFLKN